ncbi:helicase with zinc finger domain 2-like [Patiria miniata]|uniref:C2H2-type domain-containing protein n=1 Tax=Patiria miniata TaxID=46514 RepID=A0A913ZF38_PATMI|nr:helicase with zinc finger domain 2-like [Patiria miniata]
MDDDDQEQRLGRLFRSFRLLSETPEELLPPPSIVREFIRGVQQDVKEEAKALIAEEDYEQALVFLCVGIDHVGGLLSRVGYSCDTANDARLLILRSQCYNILGAHREAHADAEKALQIDPNSVPAEVERVKARFAISCEIGGGLLKMFAYFLFGQVPESVKANPEVIYIIRLLDVHFNLMPAATATKRKSDSKAFDTDWIPSHNKEIAKTSKINTSSRPSEKKRKIKQICDGAEPTFTKTGSSSSQQWVRQGARPKKSSNKTVRVPSSIVPVKSSKKQTGNAPKRNEVEHSAAVVSHEKTRSSKKTKDQCPAYQATSKNLASLPIFHCDIKHVCGICYSRGDVVEQRLGSKPLVCAGSPGEHDWKRCRMVVVYSSEKKKWRKVRRRHANAPPIPTLCTSGDACKRGGECWFPHFKEEKDLWIYMGRHKLTKLDDVVFAGRASPDVMSQTLPSKSQRDKRPQPQPQHRCSYCDKSYPQQWQLQQHIQTMDHWSKVNSDEDKKDQWKHRSPPWNVVNGQYQECSENKNGRCVFTDCTKAHGVDELEEWKERHRYRIMKVKKAKECRLYAFMDEVLDKFNFSASQGKDVIAERLPGVRIDCSEDLVQFLDTETKDKESAYTCTWSFTLDLKTSENKFLKRVCLFYDDNRLYFRLSQPANESEAQVCPGNLIVEEDRRSYRFDVIFRSQILGRFSQWVLFDLGTEPYLVRKLQVLVGSHTPHDKSDEISGEKNKFELWTDIHPEIVRFSESDRQPSTSERQLLNDYEVPTPLDIEDLGELSRDNYRKYMHGMLYLEEQECNIKISKFASESRLECLDHILRETPTATNVDYAVDGSLFGKVDLKSALMDDSETSQIIERNVRKMMLKFANSKKIYEAIILDEQNDFRKQDKDTLYIKLSPTCVKEMDLRGKTEHRVEIQLQLDRLPLCYMHSAVDRLQNMDMVFPPIGNLNKLPRVDKPLQPDTDAHQERAVRFICRHKGGKASPTYGVGPVLLCGPFGTGKTHTMATAVRRTLKERPDSKILICTHSNSAADLYITEHLHKLVEAKEIKQMTRVYAKTRDINTIGDIVLKYTKVADGKVMIPTVEKIKASSVVITTLTTSYRLPSSELYGHFTHILIDEAGQALETEVLQPLTFATGSTCVVLAGDHLQMSPKVFSGTARHAKFHISLLERLFYLKVGSVLLSSNYRTCQKMLDFICGSFYYGTRTGRIMKAVGKHEPHPRFQHPLVFCTVKGEDQKIGMSYVNHYEVAEIVSTVRDLLRDWPEDKWGNPDTNGICVVASYKMQIRQIRTQLRKGGMGSIDVLPVQSAQGKQYRVMIISTVRTRSTLNKADTTAFVSKISPANRPDDTFDYGFLSDPRLLNTACTRAQSLLIVVGDPSTLCSVGDCSKIWRRYLKDCEDNKTLQPPGTTIAGIQQEMEAAKQRLNPSAPVFQPASTSTGKLLPKGHSSEANKPTYSPEPAALKPIDDPWLPDDDTILSDGIMRELYRQISHDERRRKKSEEDPGVDIGEPDYAEFEREVSVKWKRKPPKFRMIRESDRIVLDIKYTDGDKRGADESEESDSGEGLRNDKHDERKRQNAYKQVEQRPDKFKICSFHCDKSGHTYAIPLDEGMCGKISITSKIRRGRALNLDEVIVEIFDDTRESVVSESERKYGKVICVCKRAARSALKSKVVCKLDEHIGNQMVPLDRTLPKFFVLSRDEEKRGNIKTSRASPDLCTVSIYRYSRELQEDSPFVRNVKVSRRDRAHKLFVVEYLKWFANAPYPMGVVTEELPQAECKETGLRILKLIYGVKDDWKSDIIEEVESKFPDDWEIPEAEIQSRCDARNQFAFTIDPQESQDLDDALSVDYVGENYKVGIHIADVSYFVSHGSALDKEARARATSFYPHRALAKPINMLPPQLSNKLCSLLPQKDRLTISVYATLDGKGNLVGDPEIERSVIRSHNQLSYEYVEEIIMSTSSKRNNNITITEKILTLNELAKERRRIRLGMGRFAFSHDAEEDEVQHPLAHSLVEEMMLLANEAVAIYLVKVYPDCSPLRRQLPPSDENVEQWLKNHAQDLANSLELQSRLLEKVVHNEVDVYVLKEKWNQLRSAVDKQDKITTITDLITSDENHPQLAVARADLFIIQETADYISTGEHPDTSRRGHHSLNMSVYTHFTSPIRRYFDLVVHRMLIAAINDDKAGGTLHQSERPYDTDELSSISHHCNIQRLNSQAFEKKTRALQCALRLREAPQLFEVFVGGFSDASLELIFPYRRFLPSACPLNLLKPISKPEFDGENVNMELRWKERIFELRGTTTPKPRFVSQLTLDTEQMIVKISADHWKEILEAIQAQNTDMIQRAVKGADEEQQLTEQKKSKRQNQRHLPENQDIPVEEVTCETLDVRKPSPFVNFQRSFKRGDVLKVQLNAKVRRGILSPCMQLFFLTPKLSLCGEHRGNAIECFSKEAARRPPTHIGSVEQYQAVWLPIIQMVSAYSAVVSDESCVIHDVDVDWHCAETDDQERQYSGTFMIKQTFCSDRSFGMHRGDYLCMRYRDVPLSSEAQSKLRELGTTPTSSQSHIQSSKTTFVAHAVITFVEDIEEKTDAWTIQVKVGVNQLSAPFPDVLFEQSKKVPTCTIELIPKASSDIRLESAVRHLHNAKELVKGICMHQIPAVSDTDPVIRKLLEEGRKIDDFSITGSPFPKPNESQQTALKKALRQHFTVIQGPPGTGKTVTGVHLTYFFTEVNKQLPALGRRPQVLYCGPSNKSVDVVAHYMLRLNIAAVRVYNNMIEQQDYPTPGQSGRASKAGSTKETKMDPHLRQISLHHLIRQPSNRHCEEILALEQTFQSPGYKISFREQDKYKRAIHEAEAEELKKYKVVLCTCNEAGSIRIQRNVNAIQCIVDEAGMCNEPETLIPLVGTIEESEDQPFARKKDVRQEPRQIVLIGDHKQLRPIIQERTAVQLGMETSLLEKYGKEATMLTIQYRMHESICAFPSEVFYKGKLVTADIVRRQTQQLNKTWPGGRGNPLVFCHHIGSEDKQSVRTEEGGEQSRANPQEVTHVLRIASNMVRLGVKQDRIVILTQYRLQRAQIEERLKEANMKDILVSTVITSQGKEWDYVILSTVRSLPRVEIDEKASTAWKKRNLGFITDENQINVAITRPKMGLIILGNKYLLSVHRTWKDLLAHYKEKGALVNAKDFLP